MRILEREAFKTLGINESMALKEARLIYRKLSNKFHPDKLEGIDPTTLESDIEVISKWLKEGKTPADIQAEINTAWEIIKDHFNPSFENKKWIPVIAEVAKIVAGILLSTKVDSSLHEIRTVISAKLYNNVVEGEEVLRAETEKLIAIRERIRSTVFKGSVIGEKIYEIASKEFEVAEQDLINIEKQVDIAKDRKKIFDEFGFDLPEVIEKDKPDIQYSNGPYTYYSNFS